MLLTRPRPSLGAAPSYLDSLTGLRFLAALSVFTCHTWVIFAAAGMKPFRDLAKEAFLPGATGVIFFFVLSGFVLTWSAGDRVRPGSFYRRRFARIVPNYLVVWLVFMTIAVVNRHGLGLEHLASFFLVQSWFPPDRIYIGIYAVLWSLSVEVFFYAVFPYVLPVVRRLTPAARRVGMAAALLTTISVGVVTAPQPPGSFRLWFAIVFPPMELPVFLLGVLLALELRNCRPPTVPLPFALLAVAAGWTWLALAPVRTSDAAVMLVPFCLLIVAAAQRDLARSSSVFAGRVMTRLGAWSYAFYLVHAGLLILLVYATTWWGPDLSTLTAPQGLGVMLVGLTIAIAVSASLFTLVERPFELWLRPKRGKAVSPARTRVLGRPERRPQLELAPDG